ncbi:hypothetical protein PVK06_020910 [Gossypium arboreum]|uniref:Uncharacterized protein n=1 Tax=Gossypium arboreum TaxID=29729 RepID=A0ABR0PNL6_GOSAR|nr:hypothetical protein PVK06_020910 [Gossypium arboreum]
MEGFKDNSRKVQIGVSKGKDVEREYSEDKENERVEGQIQDKEGKKKKVHGIGVERDQRLKELNLKKKFEDEEGKQRKKVNLLEVGLGLMESVGKNNHDVGRKVRKKYQ